MTTKVYELVTERIINAVQKTGILPWKRPWKTYGAEALPKNLMSKKAYRGINILLLSMMPYESTYWVTFNQCSALGGRIKKGEKGAPIVFWKILEKEKITESGIRQKKIPLLRYSTVFNIEQCEGLELPAPIDRISPVPSERFYRAEEIIKNYTDRPSVLYGEGEAYYSVFADIINMPVISSFASGDEFYCTYFHELGHSTGHRTRLNRDMVTRTNRSEKYGKEELIAEISASFLCAEAGIAPTTFDNSVSYLKGWIDIIKAESKMLLDAASQAQKACDWILKRGNPVPNPIGANDLG